MNATPLKPCQSTESVEVQEITTRKGLIRAEGSDANSLFSLLLSSVQSTAFLSDYGQKHQGRTHQHHDIWVLSWVTIGETLSPCMLSFMMDKSISLKKFGWRISLFGHG